MIVTRRAFLGLALGGAGAGGLGLTGVITGRRMPAIEAYEVEIGALPGGLDGFRILLVADIHAGAFMDRRRMDEVVGMLNALRADLVLVAGDMVDGVASAPDMSQFAGAFSEVESRFGIFAVPGNHDHNAGVSSLERGMAGSGIGLLRDDHHRLECSGGDLLLIGIDDPRDRRFDPPQDAAVEAAVVRAPSVPVTILLSHRPAAFEAAARVGIPLTLAGHTHGGQIALPWRESTPVRFFTRYVRGRYRLGGSQLIVTTGVGTGRLPLRVGVPPSVALLTLRTVGNTAPRAGVDP